MKAFLVFDRYGFSYDSDYPRMEDIEMIFIGDDQKDAAEEYCHNANVK